MKSFNSSSRKPDRDDLVGRIVAAYKGAGPDEQCRLIDDLKKSLAIISNCGGGSECSRHHIDEQSRPFPVMHEAALEELAGHLKPGERRAKARKFERWAAQLVMSAQLIEAANPDSAKPMNLDDVICLYDQWGDLNGKTAAECLAEAARLEEKCGAIRQGLIKAGIIRPDREQAERQQFIFPN